MCSLLMSLWRNVQLVFDDRTLARGRAALTESIISLCGFTHISNPHCLTHLWLYRSVGRLDDYKHWDHESVLGFYWICERENVSRSFQCFSQRVIRDWNICPVSYIVYNPVKYSTKGEKTAFSVIFAGKITLIIHWLSEQVCNNDFIYTSGWTAPLKSWNWTSEIICVSEELRLSNSAQPAL